MASSNLYQTEQYSHKKFAKHTNKRKQDEMEDKENAFSAQTILDMATKEVAQMEQPLAKRKQTKALFRPWLDKEDTKKDIQKPSKVLNAITPNIPANHRTQLAQPKYNRKQLSTLIHQYNQQAQQYMLLQQQYYAFYHQQQVAANLRNVFYLQQLQQMAAVQQQKQIFVFGQH